MATFEFRLLESVLLNQAFVSRVGDSLIVGLIVGCELTLHCCFSIKY